MPVGCQIGQFLNFAGGPANGQAIDALGVSETEMHDAGHLRPIRIERIHFPDNRLPLHRGNQTGADAEAITFLASQRDFQVVLLREIVFVKDKRPAAGLAEN